MCQRRFRTLAETFIIAVVILSARLALGQERGPSSTPPPPTRVPDDSPPTLPPPMSPPTPKPDGRISVQLRDGSRLVGKLVGLDKLKLKASFGEIAVPVDSIVGVRFPTVGNPAIGATAGATVLFSNGDILTAEPMVASLKLETAWGETTIAGKHLESLVMTTERVQWVFDGKWRLAPEGAALAARGPYAPPAGGGYTTAPEWSPVPYGPPVYPTSSPGPVYSVPAFRSPSTLPGPPTLPVSPMAVPSLTPPSP